MRATALAVLALLAAGCTSGPPQGPIVDGSPFIAEFDRSAVGAFPRSWITGPEGNWSVVAEATAPTPPNVLRGRADGGGASTLVSPTGLYDRMNATLSVMLLTSAANNTTAGFVLNWVEASRYEVVRADARARELVLERHDAGNVTVLARGPAPVPSEGWFTFSVRQRGGYVDAMWGDAAEPALRHEGGARFGAAGVWVPAGGQALFDRLQVIVPP